MYIIDGIAYAGEREAVTEIVSVRVTGEYELYIRFRTGESGVFDFSPLLNDPAFLPLKNTDVFRGVYLDDGIPCWNDGEIDISPDYLYQHAVLDKIRDAS